MEEGRTAVKEIGGKVSKYVYRLRPAFYYQHRRTNEDFFNDTCRRCRDNRGRERVKELWEKEDRPKKYQDPN